MPLEKLVWEKIWRDKAKRKDKKAMRRKKLFEKRARMVKYKSMAPIVSLRIRQLTNNITRHEQIVKDSLDRLNLRYKFQRGFMCKGEAVRIVDFILLDNLILLEIDGKSHIGKEVEDARREAQILQSKPGYIFLRIWNSEIDDNINTIDSYIFNRIWKRRHEAFGDKRFTPSIGFDNYDRSLGSLESHDLNRSPNCTRNTLVAESPRNAPAE